MPNLGSRSIHLCSLVNHLIRLANFINLSPYPMRYPIKYLFLFLAMFLPSFVLAAPTTEKTPTSEATPLDILSSQPEKIFLTQFGDYKDEYLFVVSSSSISIIDTTTWAAYPTEIENFSTSVVDVGFLTNGTSLIVALSNGDLAQIELDDESTFVTGQSTDSTDSTDSTTEETTDDRVIDTSSKMTSAGISDMVIDPDNDVAYMVNSSGYYFEYNFTTKKLTELELTSSDTTDTTDTTDTSLNYSPTDMLFAKSSAGDKILVSTDENTLIEISPGSGSYTEITNSSSAVENTPTFTQMALTPDEDYALIIDSANDVLWVFSFKTGSFVDQQSSGTSLDPIEIDSDKNSAFTDLAIYTDDDETVAYVSGTSGLTMIDASDMGSASSSTKVVDADSATDGADDPVAISATPGPLATSSDGYIYCANGDATVSIITDNPFISISLINPSSVNATTSSFAITFQSDAAGTYSVRINSDPSGTEGTELISSTSLTDVDTDTTTSSIDINSFSRSIFNEGSNKVFIFLTDANNITGRSAVLLTVDRPPLALTITGTGFGNQKAYLTFVPSDDDDIDTYQLYAEPAESQTSPSCPGSLTFDSSATISGTLEPTSCTTSSCTGIISNLTNNKSYCLAARAVDNSGQSGDLSSYSIAITPEQTVGPAGYLGETGCSLNLASKKNQKTFFIPSITGLGFFLLALIFTSPRIFQKRIKKTSFILPLLIVLTWATPSFAQEKSPQSWTAEPKISLWIPTDSGAKTFFSPCCNLGGEFEFGYLLKDRYNFTVTVGFAYHTGSAVGVTSGSASADTYSLMMFPVRLDFIYRFDLKSEQLFLPYLRSGLDTVIFRETSGGSSLNSYKFGLHAGAGVGILLDRIENLSSDMENDMGINDVYLVLEGRYAFINSFKSTGLDLSGFYPYLGVLFEF